MKGEVSSKVPPPWSLSLFGEAAVPEPSLERVERPEGPLWRSLNPPPRGV